MGRRHPRLTDKSLKDRVVCIRPLIMGKGDTGGCVAGRLLRSRFVPSKVKKLPGTAGASRRVGQAGAAERLNPAVLHASAGHDETPGRWCASATPGASSRGLSQEGHGLPNGCPDPERQEQHDG